MKRDARNASLIFVAKDQTSLTVDRIVGALHTYATDMLSYFSEHNREVKETLNDLIPIFERDHVAIVMDGQTFVGLITRVDLINHLKLNQ